MIDPSAIVQAIGALAAVLGLVVAAGLALRRLDRSRFGLAGGSTPRLEILAQRMIDPRTRVVLLRCDGSEHLVVVGAAGCTRLPLHVRTPAQVGAVPPS